MRKNDFAQLYRRSVVFGLGHDRAERKQTLGYGFHAAGKRYFFSPRKVKTRSRSKLSKFGFPCLVLGSPYKLWAKKHTKVSFYSKVAFRLSYTIELNKAIILKESTRWSKTKTHLYRYTSHMYVIGWPRDVWTIRKYRRCLNAIRYRVLFFFFENVNAYIKRTIFFSPFDDAVELIIRAFNSKGKLPKKNY